ncbi:hypothetical protein GCM10010360_64200 [Streptomyces nogalater]
MGTVSKAVESQGMEGNPRSRRDDLAVGSQGPIRCEQPPLARGRRRKAQLALVLERAASARAGTTPPGLPRAGPPASNPRGRGYDLRGLLDDPSLSEQPARAGTTGPVASASRWEPSYPRSRGDDSRK